mmetsp:Transcript_38754/g.97628  ORF Transcript_38754/g.97628 Transcript_38754/m.97628 type:complete len:200 (+) Transcript_38754:92-691(+)
MTGHDHSSSGSSHPATGAYALVGGRLIHKPHVTFKESPPTLGHAMQGIYYSGCLGALLGALRAAWTHPPNVHYEERYPTFKATLRLIGKSTAQFAAVSAMYLLTENQVRGMRGGNWETVPHLYAAATTGALIGAIRQSAHWGVLAGGLLALGGTVTTQWDFFSEDIRRRQEFEFDQASKTARVAAAHAAVNKLGPYTNR